MQKFLLLCCAILFVSSAGLAQSGPAGTVFVNADSLPTAVPLPAALPATPQAASQADLTSWQMAFTYQFSQFHMPQQPTNGAIVPTFTATDNGFDVSLTRFLINWAGLEAKFSQGFGGTSTSLIKDSRVLLVVGGPHFALRGHGRVEPWGHVLVGLAHFNFSQTATTYGSNNSVAFLGGGGADFHLNPRTAFRVQGDYVGTALFKTAQTNFEVGAGIVFNF